VITFLREWDGKYFNTQHSSDYCPSDFRLFGPLKEARILSSMSRFGSMSAISSEGLEKGEQKVYRLTA
jgi:hypothetical protein